MHAQVNGTRLWFDVDGPSVVPDGRDMRGRPTVILLHGGPGSFDHSYLKPDFGRLAKVAQVVYLDIRDHGRSDRGDPRRWTFEAAADDIPAFCDVVGIQKPIVYGHSFGGFVAMLYGARHPDHPGGLILDGTAGRFDPKAMVERFRKLGGDAIARIMERVYVANEPVTAEEWAPCWKLFGRHVPEGDERARTVLNAELNKLGLEMMGRWNALDQLRRIECPTLVCVGEVDPGTPVASAREILGAMEPGVGRLAIIQGAGHFAWRDEPERYWPVLEEFVTTTHPPPSA